MISATVETLLKQALMTAHVYLCEAIKSIDQKMGDGYAKLHPELIAAYMAAAASDFNTSVQAKSLAEASDQIADAIKNFTVDAR